jgi:hypothetical protein
VVKTAKPYIKFLFLPRKDAKPHVFMKAKKPTTHNITSDYIPKETE